MEALNLQFLLNNEYFLKISSKNLIKQSLNCGWYDLGRMIKMDLSPGTLMYAELSYRSLQLFLNNCNEIG